MIVLHCADWHLGNAGNRLDRETGLNGSLMDRYRCARFCVEDGITRGAQLVLHAGDVFDSCRPTPTERRLALDSLEPVGEAFVYTIALVGNHDASRSPTEKHALDMLREAEGVLVVDQPQVFFFREHPDDHWVSPCAPADAELQVACLPWPNRQLLLTDEEHRKLDPGQLNLLMREKVMDCLRGLRAQCIPDVPAILLAHLSVDTAQAGAQNRMMLLGADWSVNLHELEALGFAACLLGHIHRPQAMGSRLTTVYAGSPEACSFGEEGAEHNCVLWGISRDGKVTGEPIPTPYRRLVTLDEVESPGVLASVNEAPGKVADAIVRVRLPQSCADQASAVRRRLEELGAVEVRMEIERAENVRRREVEVSTETSLDDALRAWLEQRPDLKPMTDELLAEARVVEAAAEGNAA
jgi:exonuclease SbcD